MNCPPDVATVVLKLLRHGFLRIRGFATAREPKKCFIEADHLHNLPALVSDYRPEMLHFYWEIERPSFIQQVPETERRDLQAFWDELAPLVARETANVRPLVTRLGS